MTPWRRRTLLALLVTVGLLGVPAAAHARSASAPSGLTVAIADGGVQLTWAAPTEDTASVTGYEILRRLPGVDPVGEFDSLVADTESTDTTYLDAAVTAGTSYTYRVKAIRGETRSTWSNYARADVPHAQLSSFITKVGDGIAQTSSASADVPHTKPGSLAVQMGDSGASLSWAIPTGDAASVTGYEILRRLPGVDAVGEFDSLVADTGSTGNTYLDTSVTAGTSYTYRVKAIRGETRSAWSNYARIDVPTDYVPADDEDETDHEAVCAVSETTHSEPVSGGVYRIAYSSIGSGVGINVMSADGTGRTMITSHDADTSEPVWSPDSSKITYTVKTGGDREVFVVGAGGTGTTRLTSDSRQNQWPSWSPDGTEIIFESAETMGGYSKIVSIGPDATARTDVFDSTTYRSPHIPQWSPDGRTIAVKASGGIVLFDADGTDVTRVPETGRTLEEFAWSPDSTKVAYEQSGQVYVVTVKTAGSTDNTDSGDDIAVALLTKGFGPTWSPDGTKILFRNWADRLGFDDGHRDFFTIEPDGTDLTRLTSSERAEYAASWKPDGTQIAFHAYPDGDSEIFVIDSDGTAETRLTRNNDQDTNPVWSPDGTKIAYNSKPTDREIFVINSDGTGKQQLTDNEVHDTSPDWSPDGTRIVFVTVDADERDGEIAVMDADGTNVTQLTDSAITEFQPVWSPDGTRIAYLTDDGADHEIAVMDADGTNVVQLTDNTVRDGDVRWSPDSTKLVYTTNDGDNEIAVIGVDGTNRQQLTSNDYLDEEPDWSPDGTRIAYTSMPTPGDFEVYTMKTDGTCPLRMTDGGQHSFRPRWSPDGEQLLYNYRLLWIRAMGLVDADGTDARIVRGSAMNGLNPAWSPDGTRIAYEILGIATVDRAGGGNIRRLTYSGDDLEPAWSPVPNSTSGGDS